MVDLVNHSPSRHCCSLRALVVPVTNLLDVVLCSYYTICACYAGCKYFNDDCLSLAAQRYGANLRAIDMHGCDDVTNTGLQQLATHCTELTSLDAGGTEISDLAVTTLVQRCPQIQTLQLRKCEQLTDSAVEAIASSLPALTSLDLNACLLVTDAALTHLGQGCPALKELDVTHCPSITKSAIVALTAQLPELTCHSFWEFYLK